MKKLKTILKVWAPTVVVASFVVLMWVLLIASIPRANADPDVEQAAYCEFIAFESANILRFRQKGHDFDSFLAEYPMAQDPRVGELVRKAGHRVYTQLSVTTDADWVHRTLSTACDKYYL